MVNLGRHIVLRTIAQVMAALVLATQVMAALLLLSTQAHAIDYVSEAEKWFADVTTMKAKFTQVVSDGTMAEGMLHLRRPHRMKIIYDLEDPLILLTTPVWLHVDRPKRKRLTSYPISETPLSLILQEDVKLRSEEFQTKSFIQDGIVSVIIEKKTGNAAGVLTLEFTEQPFELRRWTIKDATDVTTRVTLHNMRFGHKYENKFFAKAEY
ncbi:outer membrane lipoprotein carrier protein LolA [bacterium]|nr:outer membrane lipoprotein carrier protein LolA [bacterium]